MTEEIAAGKSMRLRLEARWKKKEEENKGPNSSAGRVGRCECHHTEPSPKSFAGPSPTQAQKRNLAHLKKWHKS